MAPWVYSVDQVLRHMIQPVEQDLSGLCEEEIVCSHFSCVCLQGYTALHLASIHGHQHLVRNLVNTYSESVHLNFSF